MPEQLSLKWESPVKERMSFDSLKRNARESCAVRGHDMKPLRRTHHTPGRRRAAAKCRNCPAWVNVDEHPEANGIDIGGPAVAMTCPTDPKWC